MFHKAKCVAALPDYKLLTHFIDGTDKIYNMKPLIEGHPAFAKLAKNPTLFEMAKVDVGGLGIVWNKEADIDTEEIYQNGEDTKTPFTGLIALSDATALWGLNESTLRKAISYGKLKPGIDVINFGSQWLVTTEAMKREYSKHRID